MLKGKISEIAREAGVGRATVDRVLNDRGNVSEATATRVIEAARRLGARRLLPEAHRPLIRLAFLLPTPQSHFRHRLAEAFRAYKGVIDRSLIVQVDFVDPLDVDQVVAALLSTRARAIAFCSVPSERIAAAVAALRRRGVFVGTIVGDLPDSGRQAFFGIDNRSAARTALMLVAPRTRRKGSAIVLTTGIDGSGLSSRIDAFSDALSRELPSVRLRDVLSTGDTPSLCRRELERALEKHPDTVLIYNCGAANSAVGEVLSRLDPSRRIQFIGHELTPNTRRLMQNGTMFLAIDQNPDQIARTAIDTMARACGFVGEHLGGETRTTAFVPFGIFTKENLPLEVIASPPNHAPL